MTDVYEKLADHLDRLPAGFPRTDAGIEIEILKRLFTEQEAEMATKLQMRPEPPEKIAERIGMDADAAAKILEEMSRKGLIYRSSKKGKFSYMSAQFVIGIWEYHVNDLDEDFVKLVNQYLPYLGQTWKKTKTKQLRVVPVSKTMNPQMNVSPYEEAEKIIKAQSKIVVAPCICRREHKLVGEGCDRLEEACLIFGGGAYFYEDNGLGRDISTDEALEILHKAVEEGLVIQPGNAQHAVNICLCCGCCCQVLKIIKSFPEPAKEICTNYYVEVDEDRCTGCEVCVDRCQMDAITVDGTASVNLSRCIGCGLCVVTCDAEAMQLKQKTEQIVPPKTFFDTYINIAKERGLF